MEQTKNWWKEKVIYQIYPRSYQDSNGDGIGDLPGIISRLDYIASLGVDVVWLSPIYNSPNDDNGYDISDYRSIHPDFGTMEDFQILLDGLHQRGMKLVMDLVVNHTSDEHQWFQESRKSPNSPYRDYYIWRDGKGDKPPTNWESFFGGSAWEWDEVAGQYFLHLFTKKQPDLNWENPKVRQEVKDLVKYWLDKGIDGFRMDVISVISKEYPLVDSDHDTLAECISDLYANGPRVHEYLQELHSDVLSKYDIFTVGEGPGITRSNAIEYVGKDRGELDMIFHFDHMFMDHGPGGKYDPLPLDLGKFMNVIESWDALIDEGGWLSPFFDNHDFHRVVTRFGNDKEYREESAKLFAILLLTLRGTPSIYMGTEIGMTNREFSSIDQCRDVEGINFYHIHVDKGGDPAAFMKIISQVGRDNVRTPMQWSDQSQGGFTKGTPWIDINPNYTTINVEQAEQDEGSILHFYRSMLALRKIHPFIVYGTFHRLQEVNGQAVPADVFCYERRGEHETWLILLNISGNTYESLSPLSGTLLLGNYDQASATGGLRPWEAKIISLK